MKLALALSLLLVSVALWLLVSFMIVIIITISCVSSGCRPRWCSVRGASSASAATSSCGRPRAREGVIQLFSDFPCQDFPHGWVSRGSSFLGQLHGLTHKHMHLTVTMAASRPSRPRARKQLGRGHASASLADPSREMVVGGRTQNIPESPLRSLVVGAALFL